MRYPVAIEVGDENTAYGVVVPDLPGCFSAGDTLDDALTAAEEAIAGWIDATLDAGGTIPAPSSLDDIRLIPEYAGWVFAVVTIDPAALEDTVDRVNITLPRRVLHRLDALAKAKGETRSGYIAQLTLTQS
jgi:predicted RNase H-like HicB family nuclease